MAPGQSDDESGPKEELPRGPKGGRTTVSRSGALVKKTLWLDSDVEEALRQEAFDTRRSEAEIVRQMLRERYGME